MLCVPPQRWAVSLELAAARSATAEASLKSQKEALDSQAASVAAQSQGLQEQQRQLEELSRDVAKEREQLERLAAQLEVGKGLARGVRWVKSWQHS